MIQVGDRVKVVRMRQFKKELVEEFNDYPIEVVEVSEAWAGGTRYKIEMHNVLNVLHSKFFPQGTNVIRWVGEDDITLDIEYYRNLKLEKLLNE
jgi:hypothetical protein